MQKKTDHIFTYPPNLHELDLATMVSMYRDRGEPRRAAPGKYLACCLTRKLVKDAKWWFGLYYSQLSWDKLLTRNSGGYPLTEAEMSALGLIFTMQDDPPQREFIEKNMGVLPKLAYLIINDIRQFGFIEESEHGLLTITQKGEQALNGISRRLYGKRFTPAMLELYQNDPEFARKIAPEDDQPTLF